MIKFILILIAVISTAFAATNGKCSGRTGICIDSSKCSNYGGKTYSGKCPSDPNNIKCCDNIPCKGSDGRTGTCSFSCSGDTVTGQCPGGTDFKCCIGGGGGGDDDYYGPCRGGGGACINSDTVTCETSFVTGKCPGGNNFKCCLGGGGGGGGDGKKYYGPCSGGGGACIDTSVACDTSFVSGRCPGGNGVKCCTAGSKPSWYINQLDYTETICIIDGKKKSVATSGCGMASLTMGIGSVLGDKLNPTDLFREAYKQGYYHGDGFSHDAIKSIGKQHGVSVSWTSDIDKVYSALESGKGAIFHVGHESVYDFTGGGHYIYLKGAKEQNGIKKVYVFDPNGKNNYKNVLFALKSSDGGIQVAKKGTGADFGIVSKA